MNLLCCKINYVLRTQSRSWWMWRSWLTRQFVALEIVGSSPIFHPIYNKILGCSQAAEAVRAKASYSISMQGAIASRW